MGWREKALARWYHSQPGWMSGSQQFREWTLSGTSGRARCLEIGPGPGSKTTNFLGQHFTRVDGIDVDVSIVGNPSLSLAIIYDGSSLPMHDDIYDCVVADYVLEHLSTPDDTFREIARVLKPGGRFFFRTPNLWHYVALASKISPHSVHEALVRKLHGINSENAKVYPTHYLTNTRRGIKRLAAGANLRVVEIRMIETEPSYGLASPILYYPLLVYERIVNCHAVFSTLRSNIFGVLEKPQLDG